MAMNVSYSFPARWMTRSALHLNNVSVPADSPWPMTHSVCFLTQLCSHALWGDSPTTVKSLLGARPSTAKGTSTFFGLPPTNTPYSLNRDMRWFGSAVRYLQPRALRTIRRGASESGDKDVIHESYTGLARFNHRTSRDADFTEVGTTTGPWDVSVPTFPSDPGRTTTLWNQSEPQEGNGECAFEHHYFIESILDSLVSATQDDARIYSDVLWVSAGNYLKRGSMANFSYRHDIAIDGEPRLTIEYTQFLKRWDGGEPINSTNWSEVGLDIRVELISFLRGVTALVPDTEYEHLGRFTSLRHFQAYSTLERGNATPHTVQSWVSSVDAREEHAEAQYLLGNEAIRTASFLDTSVDDTAALHPTLSPRTWVSPVRPKGLVTRRHPEGAWSPICTWATLVDEDLANLLPSLYYSTADGITKHTDVIRTNHIETLAELSDMLLVLPDFGRILSILQDVRSLRLLDAGKSILDVVTAANLSLSFVAEPSYNSLVEFSDQFDNARERLESAGHYGWHTIYGKFIYELPDGEYGLSTPTLVSRSKLRVNFGASSMLTAALKAQAFGLMPDLSAIWDVIPLSFVVDWFLNIGARLDTVDSAAVMLLLPTKFATHSLTIYDELSDDLLSDLSFDPVPARGDEDFPAMRYYKRIVSGMLPRFPSSTKYDFLEQTRPLDFGLVGSLAYQIFS